MEADMMYMPCLSLVFAAEGGLHYSVAERQFNHEWLRHLHFLLQEKDICCAFQQNNSCCFRPSGGDADLVLSLQEERSLPGILLRGTRDVMRVEREERPAITAERIALWYVHTLAKIPLWGCILIGGKSRRMGSPKHLLHDTTGRTWLERTVELMQGHVDKVVVAGQGQLPASLTSLPRVADVAEMQGPLAGILGACRTYRVSWLVVACDMPMLAEAGLQWLLNQRSSHLWGVVPRQENGRLEPLCAWYDFRSRKLFEQLSVQQEMRIKCIADSAKIATPVIPNHLTRMWSNLNRPEDIVECL